MRRQTGTRAALAYELDNSGQDSLYRQYRDSARDPRMELDFVQQMNREQLAATGPDAAPGRANRIVRAGVSHAVGSAWATEPDGASALQTRCPLRAGEPHLQVGSAFRSVA